MRPAAWRAVARVLKLPAAIAVSTMSFEPCSPALRAAGRASPATATAVRSARLIMGLGA
jgi:hypothetical protein